ncbi:Rho-binding antiterminator [Pseudoalteromonas luteoviolacea]|uniref:Rho-binding antiterminator n=1 Tax=Pseudoalteromonas luteoviolacea NCIMB 1942 TaxID=1365253 RepID=A0A167AKS5_9GAMM|nr:Rho-binding antiterminator [Pseudoalteromonas luteoviolacea]KZN45509.1 hypothetical protein N482_14825 [Pseudoalteromonas luteoviolacea NCIMB 1942]KZX02114.1 hypothetical protein JL49_01820 [Pseudoalteromonas luteoviolacea]
MRCEHTDYLELACIKGFELRVTTRGGESFTGHAKDIIYDKQKCQCLMLVHNSESLSIPLEALIELEALTPNTYFTTLRVDS